MILDTRCDPRFRPLLDGLFDLAALEAHPYAVVGLWRDTTLAYFNPAWREFAVENCGEPLIDSEWGLGRSYLDAISEPLRGFYEALLFAEPTTAEALRPRTHHYECSSATTFREFAMQIFALPEQKGWVIINSLSVEMPHDIVSHRPHAADPAMYSNDHGLVRQCSHCRRVQRTDDEHRWDWVPDWVGHPVKFISHGICATCYAYYFRQELARLVPKAT